MKYIVIKAHRSEYPDPLGFEKRDPLTIGEKYAGPEGREGRHFCATPSHTGGGIPRRIIEPPGGGTTGRALEDYTSRELHVDKGDVSLGERILNGWVWCRRPDTTEAGWVPLDRLQVVRN